MAQPSPREPGLGGVPTGRLRGTCVGTMPGATSCRLCRGRVRILRGSLTRFRMCVTERILMAAPLLPPTAGLAAGSARPHHGGPHPPITLLSCWSAAAVLGALRRRHPRCPTIASHGAGRRRPCGSQVALFCSYLPESTRRTSSAPQSQVSQTTPSRTSLSSSQQQRCSWRKASSGEQFGHVPPRIALWMPYDGVSPGKCEGPGSSSLPGPYVGCGG